jgi:peptide-methionine (S)-S-oxide reductase
MSETAVLGGGCFWCIEALYKQLKGVDKVLSGYAGGHLANPTYEKMHYEDTGHAEVIQVTFDPKIISYRELLEIFYAVHDPTTLNQQGNDVGEEYRSIILYQGDEQKQTAEDVTKNFATQHWDKPIVTEIKPLDTFYPAEDYHQNFFENNPDQAYCQIIINPKLTKFRQKFPEKLKTN